LGFYDTVERAPYDPVISQGAIRELVTALPEGERDYLAALRAYSDSLYGRLLEASGRRLLLDKTPAYALVLDFVAKLYPRARYIVLTRNPLAVWSSYVQSFFDGDHDAALRFNPILERYVPAVARFLREAPVAIHRVRYEDLVADPEAKMRKLSAFLGLAFEPAMVDYGEADAPTTAARGLGDPITVAREKRPTTRSLSRWAEELAGHPDKIQQAREILARLMDPDLAAWGFSRTELAAELAAIPEAGPARRRTRLTRYALERRLLVRLRRNVHHNALGRLLRRIRTACDVLLR
ncbi:MAG: sulfotransferase, partial [Myxococcales bacterium]